MGKQSQLGGSPAAITRGVAVAGKEAAPVSQDVLGENKRLKELLKYQNDLMLAKWHPSGYCLTPDDWSR